ncbi:MAG: HAD family hydrolase [Coprobacillaceae bacterium]
MKYKAIIYDLDGTVVDTVEANFIPLQQLIKEELKQDIPYHELLKFVTYPGIKTIEELGFSNIEESYQKWVDKVNAYPNGAKPYPNIVTVLDSVSKQGITQAVVSSKKKAQYQIDIVNQGLGIYFDVVVLEEDTVKHKPDPEPLLTCCSQLGLQPQEVIYIGDGYSDYQSCLAANIDFGFASWGSVEKREMQSTYVFNSPLDILNIIK